MVRRPLSLLALLAPLGTTASHLTQLFLAQETPFIPGYFQQNNQEPAIPKPTSPPQRDRQLVPRDQATCGWYMSDGSPNVCGENQYCFTTATDDQFGIWNCCNPNDCFTQTACSYSVECSGDTPYCVTSFMSHSGTTFSRFMCETTSSIISMAYVSSDTPQYTSSLLSASRASEASEASAASASSASAASESARTATAASQTAGSTSSSAPPLSSITNPPSDPGVSPGTIAGAVVGSAAGIAIISGLAFFIWRMRRKNNGGGGGAYAPQAQYEMSSDTAMHEAYGGQQQPPRGYQGENYKPYPHGHGVMYANQGIAAPLPPSELDSSAQPPVVHELPPHTPR